MKLCHNTLFIDGKPEDLYKFVIDSEGYNPANNRSFQFCFNAHRPVPYKIISKLVKATMPRGFLYSVFGPNKAQRRLQALRTIREIRNWQSNAYHTGEVLSGRITENYKKGYVDASFITRGPKPPIEMVEYLVNKYPKLDITYKYEIEVLGIEKTINYGSKQW